MQKQSSFHFVFSVHFWGSRLHYWSSNSLGELCWIEWGTELVMDWVRELFHGVEWSFIAAQIAGLMTAAIAIWTTQLKDMKWVLILQVLSNLLTVVNFGLLSEWSGAWICFVAIAQTLWIYYYTRDQKRFPKRLNYLFMLLYTVVVALTFTAAYDILAWVAALAYAFAVVQMETSKYRLFIMVNASCWILYDFITGAYTLMLTQILILLSVIIAIVRLDRKKKAVEG